MERPSDFERGLTLADAKEHLQLTVGKRAGRIHRRHPVVDRTPHQPLRECGAYRYVTSENRLN
jgi:hypothetical protein